ncbi:SDR family NAD(P)-dependent oxidoreductase [Saccharibacillus sp. CPCC 101409]|uniref:SDR family NAD(P)-dependent oxidoreductase n=1 Tax=Saccharibacillus sp. CPCC 101409 TaxID=3058041 RepID=UPI002672C3F1|nr:SDR family NAD(P)-dependent oxidoreductase [Saccharibacillus sp. CPCC 101409]MDO3408277.1 SDR family NAD(P)-dependent oxidoreductase [Saccharibacillus sp. CPCC 101409]
MPSSSRMNGKVSVVTGAGSGIGRAAALLLAEEGARLILIDRDTQFVEGVRAEIEAAGGEALAFTVDISVPGQYRDALEQAVSRYGRIDTLFANAGILGVVGPIESIEDDEFDATLLNNVKGTFTSVKYAIPYLKANEKGSIVLTSSLSGTRVFSQKGFSAYSTSKASIAAFGQMAAFELGPSNIRVNIVAPGTIETNISGSGDIEPEAEDMDTKPVEYPDGTVPLPEGSGKPEQVAKLVAFLSSDDSEHISGAVVHIDGAESLFVG